tara:strand:- start:6828 stop:7190 length:363 start_codon:yes stop_codon:yes gene_type:complete
MRQSLALAEVGPMTSTSLYGAGRLLDNSDDAVNSLDLIDTDERREDYRSLLDWLLAANFPSLKRHINSYYNDDGPLLKDFFSDEVINRIDENLIACIQAYTEILNACPVDHRDSGTFAVP